MNSKYSLIIFDWDGTLIDSIGNIVTALAQAAEQLALPVLADEDYKGIIGLSLNNITKVLYPELDEEGRRQYIEAYKVHHLRLEQQHSVPYPGVTSGLARLQEKGVHLAVATGKSRRGLSRSMGANEYASYFVASRCADETESKPGPLMLKQLLDELEVPVEKALMVGDSDFDMAMAVNMGMDRMAVTYGAQTGEKLKAFDPVFVADTFDQLVDWVDGAASAG